jgi:hypothetical protein
MSPQHQIVIRLADPAELVLGRVNTRWLGGGAIELLLDRTEADPASVPVLTEARDLALRKVVPLLHAHGPPPIVRYYVERHIPGGRLVHVEPSPWQTDVYLAHGLLPQEMADELAGHSTNLLRHFPL